jgi:hypothetical protein
MSDHQYALKHVATNLRECPSTLVLGHSLKFGATCLRAY